MKKPLKIVKLLFIFYTISFQVNASDEPHSSINRNTRLVSDATSIVNKEQRLRIPNQWIIELNAPPLLRVKGKQISAYHLSKKVESTLKSSNLNRKPIDTTFLAYNNELLAAQKTVIESIRKTPTIRVKGQFSKVFNGLIVNASEIDAKALESIKGVKRIYKDVVVSKQLSNGVEMIGATEVWQRQDSQRRGITGQGILVAVIDTGVDFTHPDLGGCFGLGCKVNSGYDFVDNDDTPEDVDGHGTHVAGIIAANGNLRGVAPDANIMAIKALDDDGYGFSSDIIRAIEYAVDPDGDITTDDGADVINLSLGGVGSPDDPTSKAVDAAFNAGVVVVAAAGNEGNYGDIANFSPASARAAITVGSVDPDRTLSSFSSKGPAVGGDTLKPEVLAPGGNIESLAVGGSTKILSGTSMASPHVAGVAALLLQALPQSTPEEIKARLISSASDLGLDPFAQGYGLIDAPQSLDQTLLITNANLFLGRLDDSMNGSVIVQELTIKNVGNAAQNIALSLPLGLPAEVGLDIAQTELVLASGETRAISLSAKLSNIQDIPYPDDLSGSYYDDMTIESESQNISVPLSFQRSLLLTITHDSPNSIDISVDGEDSESITWDAVGPNQDEELFVPPGRYYITVRHELKDTDIQLDNVPSAAETGGHAFIGLETYVLDINESTTINSSVNNLTRVIGPKGRGEGELSFDNLDTVSYRVTNHIDKPGITYNLTSSFDPSHPEGQTNTFFLFGHMADEINTTVSIIEKWDAPGDGIDNIYHYWNTIDSASPSSLYQLSDNIENALNVSVEDELISGPPSFGVDIYLGDYKYQEQWPSLRINSTSFEYFVVPGSNTSEPIYLSLLQINEDDSIGFYQLMMQSPPLLFQQTIDRERHGLSARFQSIDDNYVFSFDTPVFSNGYDVWEGAQIDNQESTFTGLTGTVMSGVDDSFVLFCDGVGTTSGNLSVNAVGKAGIPLCEETELSIDNNYTFAGENTFGTVTHLASASAYNLSGLYTLLVDKNNIPLNSTNLGIEGASILVGASQIAGFVNNLKVSYQIGNQGEIIPLTVEDFDDDRYQSKVLIPSQIIEKSTLSLLFTYEGFNSKSSQSLPRALTIGVDLQSPTDDFDGDGIVNANDEDNDNDGIPDIYERQHGLSILAPSDAGLDFDNDGLSNLEEYQYRTDIYNDDTDGDGVNDAEEIRLGTSPVKWVHGDRDGDGIADILVRDTDTYFAFAKRSSDSNIERIQFGRDSLDIPVTGDFDGDGKLDIAVRRPSDFHWYILNSSDNRIQRIRFGLRSEDIPVPADYDGDGITDLAVRRPSEKMWFIKNSSGSNYNSVREDGIQRIQFGLQEDDIPVPADYDGDGIADIAVRRPNTQIWYIKNSSGSNYNSSRGDGIQRIRFGLQEEDIPVPADYDGDGIDDIAVRRPSTQMWYVKNSSDGLIQRIRFGLQEADIPVPADYDGDGITDIAVRRPSTLFWYIKNSSGSNYNSGRGDGIQRIRFGLKADYVPLMAPISTRMQMVLDANTSDPNSKQELDALSEQVLEEQHFLESLEYSKNLFQLEY
jgi:minor extracellular serine protease Vpr